MIVISIFLICGCGKNISLNINSNNITNIIYDGVNIANSDFEGIVSKINENIFNDLYDLDTKGKELIITTSEYSYKFKVLDNFVVYNNEDKEYYTRIDKFDEFLKQTIAKYEDEEFFDINISTDYNIDDSDYLIKLDDSKQYIIINTYSNIYNFEVDTSNYVSLTKNKITKVESNKIICIETGKIENININFENPYNYKINITYNDGFITNMKKSNQ